jgi:hypothetical protein
MSKFEKSILDKALRCGGNYKEVAEEFDIPEDWVHEILADYAKKENASNAGGTTNGWNSNVEFTRYGF